MTDLQSMTRYRWGSLLPTLGIDAKHLTGRHGPCPICGGRDRFRFDNREGRGTYFCSSCGAGDGIALAMKVNGCDFATVAQRVSSILGENEIQPDPQRAEPSEANTKAALRRIYEATQPLTPQCMGARYFEARGVDEAVTYPASLRFAPRLRDGEGRHRPAIVATVSDANGKPVSLHRTFLTDDCRSKAADMQSPRKLLGKLPQGSCVRLSE